MYKKYKHWKINMKEIKICIAGLGNVGSSVVQSLLDSKNFINLKSNFNIEILGISAKNKNKKEYLILVNTNGSTIL